VIGCGRKHDGRWWRYVARENHVNYDYFCDDDVHIGMWVYASHAVRMTESEYIEWCDDS